MWSKVLSPSLIEELAECKESCPRIICRIHMSCILYPWKKTCRKLFKLLLKTPQHVSNKRDTAHDILVHQKAKHTQWFLFTLFMYLWWTKSPSGNPLFHCMEWWVFTLPIASMYGTYIDLHENHTTQRNVVKYTIYRVSHGFRHLEPA